MHRKLRLFTFAAATTLAFPALLAVPALAQDAARPGAGGGGAGGGGGGGAAFFGPAPGPAYNPEPAAVFSGHNLHIHATVSPDNKFVTLGAASNQTLVTGVTNFIFVTQGGFVGSPGAAGSTTNRPPIDPGIRGSSNNPPPAQATSAPLTGILAQPGMTRLAGL